MKTTIETIKRELTEAGLSFSGCYEKLPLMILNKIENMKHFGVEVLEESNFGYKVKEIITKLEKLDTRKTVICPITFKTILK